MYEKEGGVSHYSKWYGCLMKITDKDRYNFNDAVDIQSVADALNAAAIIGYEAGTLKLYGAARTIGTFFGSNDQEGAFVEINLGNYDELIKG